MQSDPPVIEIKRNPRSRRLSIRQKHDDSFVVNVPICASNLAVSTFVENSRPWIEKQLSKAVPRVSLYTWLEDPTRPFNLSSEVRTEIVQRGRSIFLSQEPSPTDSSKWTKWVRSLIDADLKAQTWALAKDHAIAINRISVRDQKTRWGSCSARKCISLNWRLVLLTCELRRHIILHELAHVLEMNHSSRFYQTLAGFDPEHAKHSQEIREVERLVMRVEL